MASIPIIQKRIIDDTLPTPGVWVDVSCQLLPLSILNPFNPQSCDSITHAVTAVTLCCEPEKALCALSPPIQEILFSASVRSLLNTMIFDLVWLPILKIIQMPEVSDTQKIWKPEKYKPGKEHL